MSELTAEFRALLPALDDGLQAMGEPVSPQQSQALLGYLAMLSKWSSAYNLTAVREPRAMLVQHVLDSVSVLPFIVGPRVLDVGSGAGLPGFVIAILRPNIQVTLVDSVAKKMTFCRQVCARLRLTNVKALHSRVERLPPTSDYDTVVARAFTSLQRLHDLVQSLLSDDGALVAMKGKHPEAELLELPPSLDISVTSVSVSQLAAERHIVRIAQGAAS